MPMITKDNSDDGSNISIIRSYMRINPLSCTAYVKVQANMYRINFNSI